MTPEQLCTWQQLKVRQPPPNLSAQTALLYYCIWLSHDVKSTVQYMDTASLNLTQASPAGCAVGIKNNCPRLVVDQSIFEY